MLSVTRCQGMISDMDRYTLWRALMLAFCFFNFSFIANQAIAGEERLPLWEFGLGGGVFSLPQYMGSDERYTIPFGFPYLIYRGEHWRMDRDGLRNRLVDKDSYSFEVSLSGGLPVKNSNRARVGMPELDFTGEIGPKLNYYLTEGAQDGWLVELPLRAAVNIQGEYLGWVTDPKLKYHYVSEDSVLHTGLDFGVHYSSELYHQTYYGVDGVYATAERAAYNAGEGLHSVFVKARIRYTFDENKVFFAAVQARTLAPGVVSDSPLVKQDYYGTVGIGIIWLFATADEEVIRDY